MMMRRTLSVLVLLSLLCAASVSAQPRPGAFSTLVTTNTGANSVSVGCAVGSTTCTGGIDAGAILLSSTSAASIDTEGGITAGSGNVAVIGTDGRIPAISSTYFANLSGTNITGVAITTATTTISGAWTFTSDLRISAAVPSIRITETDQGTDAKQWQLASSGSIFSLFAINDAESAGAEAFTISRSAATPQLLTIRTAVAYASVISPAALASGSTNNYNPTSLASSSYVILTADAGGSTLTGLTAQPSGTEITLCEPTPGAGSLTIAHESGSSTAANRFNNGAQANITLNKDTSGGVGGPCVTYWYYGVGARWLLKSTSGSVP